MSDEKPPELRPYLLAINLAWQIALPLFVFVLVGRYIDGLTHTAPLFFFIGLLLSIIVSSLLLIRVVKKIMNN